MITNALWLYAWNVLPTQLRRDSHIWNAIAIAASQSIIDVNVSGLWLGSPVVTISSDDGFNPEIIEGSNTCSIRSCKSNSKLQILKGSMVQDASRIFVTLFVCSEKPILKAHNSSRVRINIFWTSAWTQCPWWYHYYSFNTTRCSHDPDSSFTPINNKSHWT